VKCYVCDEPVPGRAKFFLLRFWAKPAVAAGKRAAPPATTLVQGNEDAPLTLKVAERIPGIESVAKTGGCAL